MACSMPIQRLRIPSPLLATHLERNNIFYLLPHLFINHIRYGLVARICRSHAVPTRPGFNSPCRNHFFLLLHRILPISFCYPSLLFVLGAAEFLLVGEQWRRFRYRLRMDMRDENLSVVTAVCRILMRRM
jgi:hypothetical protein